MNRRELLKSLAGYVGVPLTVIAGFAGAWHTQKEAKEQTRREKALADLDNIVAIQRSNGNWNYDPYMHGLANGLILARATIKGEEPKYLDAPERWLSRSDKQ